MKRGPFAPFLLLATATLAVLNTPTGKTKNDSDALAEMIERAKDLGDIRGKDMPGFRMAGDLRIWVKKDSPSNGKYLLIWTPGGNWKEQIVFNGYKRTRIGNGKQFWQIRSTDVENPAIFELERLMDVSRELKGQEGLQLSRSRPEIINDQEASCIRRQWSGGHTESMCFDPKSGVLLRNLPVKRAGERIFDKRFSFRSEEYSQFQQWAGKIYPRTMQGFDGNELLFEVKLEEITAPPELSSDFFARPKDAIPWADCVGGQMWKVKEKVPPVYPESAKTRGIDGLVRLYGVVEEDGTVSNLRLAYPSDSALGQAAVSAVSRWRYVRDACPDAMGRKETVIDVIFELRR